MLLQGAQVRCVSRWSKLRKLRTKDAVRPLSRDLDLVPRLAGVGDDYELVFTSPTDASPAIECLSPELALPITANGAIERMPGVRLVDAARKPLPTTAFGWQRF